jgi:cysteinyl-tRNA synthetase
MDLKLSNTLSGKKEIFAPLRKEEVRMYNCGPTVYNYAHIGNLRAYVFVDLLKKALIWNGYNVRQVMNITDVGHLVNDSDDTGEDKMTKAILREGKPMNLESMKEIALIYENAFVSDLKSLNISLPDVMPRASENIDSDIAIIKKLENKNFIYKISDGIYFDTAKFKDYGKLGGVNRDEKKDGARVAVNPEKKSQSDFCLWKFGKDFGWNSPWGKGFPGWHIECSGMSEKYLGVPFDIHTGGVDHIGTHHNNEIAQSESAFGVPMAKYWLHNEHLNLSGAKMAKSGDGFITLRTIEEKGFDPIAYRYYLLSAHYRTQMNFSFEALEASQNAFQNIVSHIAGIKSVGKVNEYYIDRFDEAINDDLNSPQAYCQYLRTLQRRCIYGPPSLLERATSIRHAPYILTGQSKHLPDAPQTVAATA